MTDISKKITGLVSLVVLVAMCSIGAPSCFNSNTGRDACLGCHNGQSASDRLGYLDGVHIQVECETCHGPGYMHIRFGGQSGLFITTLSRLPFDESYTVCEACHEGSVEQFLDSEHAKEQVATCHSCHDVHTQDGMSLSPVNNDQCLQCHGGLGFDSDEAIESHTVFHPVDPEGTGASRCSTCHMPPLQRLDQENGSFSHTMETIEPITSNQGGIPALPNSCSGISGCHDGTVPDAPVFDVDNTAVNETVQGFYEQVGNLP